MTTSSSSTSAPTRPPTRCRRSSPPTGRAGPRPTSANPAATSSSPTKPTSPNASIRLAGWAPALRLRGQGRVLLRSAQGFDGAGGSGPHRRDDASTWEWSENPPSAATAGCGASMPMTTRPIRPSCWSAAGLTAEEAPPENIIAAANLCDEIATDALRYAQVDDSGMGYQSGMELSVGGGWFIRYGNGGGDPIEWWNLPTRTFYGTSDGSGVARGDGDQRRPGGRRHSLFCRAICRCLRRRSHRALQLPAARQLQRSTFPPGRGSPSRRGCSTPSTGRGRSSAECPPDRPATSTAAPPAWSPMRTRAATSSSTPTGRFGASSSPMPRAIPSCSSGYQRRNTGVRV
jgi:hypothetical protein